MNILTPRVTATLIRFKGFVMLRSASLIAPAIAILLSAPAAQAAEAEDFIAFASSHCRAFIEEGRADMSFAMGKAVNKLSHKEMVEFNRRFAAKIVGEYNIDPAKGCKLDVVSMKPVVDTSHKPQTRDRRALPEAKHEIAVVAGEMGSQGNAAPVSVAYRLEKIGVSPWVITNVTLNGQPLVDRYREAYEHMAAHGGSDALLENM